MSCPKDLLSKRVIFELSCGSQSLENTDTWVKSPAAWDWTFQQCLLWLDSTIFREFSNLNDSINLQGRRQCHFKQAEGEHGFLVLLGWICYSTHTEVPGQGLAAMGRGQRKVTIGNGRRVLGSPTCSSLWRWTTLLPPAVAVTLHNHTPSPGATTILAAQGTCVCESTWTMTTFPHWHVLQYPFSRKSRNNTQLIQWYAELSAFSSSNWNNDCARSKKHSEAENGKLPHCEHCW